MNLFLILSLASLITFVVVYLLIFLINWIAHFYYSTRSTKKYGWSNLFSFFLHMRDINWKVDDDNEIIDADHGWIKFDGRGVRTEINSNTYGMIFDPFRYFIVFHYVFFKSIQLRLKISRYSKELWSIPSETKRELNK